MIMLDFTENYSFVVQDEVQGFHWNNTHATLHPYTTNQLGSFSVLLCV